MRQTRKTIVTLLNQVNGSPSKEIFLLIAVNGRFSGTSRLSIYAKLVYEIRVYSARVMLCFYVAFSFLEF